MGSFPSLHYYLENDSSEKLTCSVVWELFGILYFLNDTCQVMMRSFQPVNKMFHDRYFIHYSRSQLMLCPMRQWVIYASWKSNCKDTSKMNFIDRKPGRTILRRFPRRFVCSSEKPPPMSSGEASASPSRIQFRLQRWLNLSQHLNLLKSADHPV